MTNDLTTDDLSGRRAAAAELLGIPAREVLDVAPGPDEGTARIVTFDGVEYVVTDDDPPRVFYAKPPKDGYAGSFPLYVSAVGTVSAVPTRLVDENGVEPPALAHEPGPGAVPARPGTDPAVPGATPAPPEIVVPTDEALKAAADAAERQAEDGDAGPEAVEVEVDLPEADQAVEEHVTEPGVPAAPRSRRGR
jgi:hypothetical protein